MFVSGINTTYFVVFTQKGMSIEKIQKNEEFCSEMVSKLTNFYFGALLPELLDSRRSRQLPIRDLPTHYTTHKTFHMIILSFINQYFCT
jgi:hypothetical protein